METDGIVDWSIGGLFRGLENLEEGITIPTLTFHVDSIVMRIADGRDDDVGFCRERSSAAEFSSVEEMSDVRLECVADDRGRCLILWPIVSIEMVRARVGSESYPRCR